MSYAQWLGEIGGVINPLVMKETFDQVLRFRGQVAKLYRHPEERDCPCFNEVYGNADPDCDVCNGTGKVSGYQLEPAATFLAAFFFDPEIRQDQHQRIITQGGPVETLDGRMYCRGKWYSEIKVNDVVIYTVPGETSGRELRIISKLPRVGNSGQMIYVRCDLEKQPTRQVLGASGILERV